MKRFLIIAELTLACGISLFSLPTEAVSKWIDTNGQVHYSDTPPTETDAVSVRISGGKKNGAPPPSSSAPKSLAEREADLRKEKQGKEESAQKDSQKQADADAKKKNCDSARENLRTLESGTRLSSVDANGERVYLDDDTIQQRITEARNIAEQNCN